MTRIHNQLDAHTHIALEERDGVVLFVGAWHGCPGGSRWIWTPTPDGCPVVRPNQTILVAQGG